VYAPKIVVKERRHGTSRSYYPVRESTPNIDDNSDLEKYIVPITSSGSLHIHIAARFLDTRLGGGRRVTRRQILYLWLDR